MHFSIALMLMIGLAMPAADDAGTDVVYKSPQLLLFDSTMRGKSRNWESLRAWLREKGSPDAALVEDALRAAKERDNFAAAQIVSYLLTSDVEEEREAGRKLLAAMIDSGSSYAYVVRANLAGQEALPHSKPCDAFADFKRAHRMGNPMGTTRLGLMHFNGECTAANTGKGVDLLFEAARVGEPVAEWVIGVWMVDRAEKPARLKRGVKLLERAVKHGNKSAALDLARYFMNLDDPDYADRIVALLSEAARSGVKGAPDDLGRYLYLNRTQLDSSLARKGAEALITLEDSRSPDALYAIAVMYSNGIGVERDLAKAMSFHERAYAQGGTRSGLKLMGMHHDGEGVVQNPCAALKYARQLSSEGVSQALEFMEKHRDVCEQEPPVKNE